MELLAIKGGQGNVTEMEKTFKPVCKLLHLVALYYKLFQDRFGCPSRFNAILNASRESSTQ